MIIQLCDWKVTAELWPGAVHDFDYNRREGCMKRHEAFANIDLVELETGRV